MLINSTQEKKDKIENLHAGSQTSVHYPAVHKFSIYSQYKALLPKTNISQTTKSLPMYGSLTNSEIDFIVGTLNHLLND